MPHPIDVVQLCIVCEEPVPCDDPECAADVHSHQECREHQQRQNAMHRSMSKGRRCAYCLSLGTACSRCWAVWCASPAYAAFRSEG